MRDFKDLKIAVAGTGYVGLSIATLLSQHHKVMAVDIVPEKVELINSKKSPIQDEYIEKYLAEKELDLTATLDAKEAYALGHILQGSPEADEKYLKILFKYLMGKECNFDNPQTYSEKLQWLKIYDRNPLYTQLVDKYEVRKFIEERIGSEHLIPCLGVWNHFDEIDFNKLPNQFVLKCTHDSGGLIICKDKSTLDLKQARKKIEHCLKRNYFLNHREWPYKDVKPRIIAEEYTVDESGYELKDYKIFCFNGEPKAMFIATDRGTDTKFDFFDTEFHHLPFTNGHPNADKEIKKPENFDEMLRIAGILSKGMPEVRVDLYNVNGKILFGEMTFFHWSGLMPFEPEEWDYKFGSWIELPEVR